MINHSLREEKLQQFVVNVEKWFRSFGRRFYWRINELSPYEFGVLEILLWKTKAETVEKFYKKFIEKYPTPETLSKADLKSLEEDLRPLGLYKRRAILLKNFGRILTERSLTLPQNYQELSKLPGLGQYAARAILCFAFDKPTVPIDTNVRRVLNRALKLKVKNIRKIDDNTEEFLKKLIKFSNSPKNFVWGLLDLGALICKNKNPRCIDCPLQSICNWYQKVN